MKEKEMKKMREKMPGKMPMKDHAQAMADKMCDGSKKAVEGKPGQMKPEDCTTCKM